MRPDLTTNAFHDVEYPTMANTSEIGMERNPGLPKTDYQVDWHSDSSTPLWVRTLSAKRRDQGESNYAQQNLLISPNALVDVYMTF